MMSTAAMMRQLTEMAKVMLMVMVLQQMLLLEMRQRTVREQH
jgi:hypothetical protein